MSKRFKGLSDFDLVLMIYKTKKAGYPEDREFIKGVQLELSKRAKVRREGKWK